MVLVIKAGIIILGTFSVAKFFRYRYQYFFPTPKFSGRGTFFPGPNFSVSGPILFFGQNLSVYWFLFFFQNQIFPLPVPVLFFGTKFFPHRDQYHPKRSKIPGAGNSQDRDVTLWLVSFSNAFGRLYGQIYISFGDYNNNPAIIMISEW